MGRTAPGLGFQQNSVSVTATKASQCPTDASCSSTGGNQTCNRSGLSRAALLVWVSGREQSRTELNHHFLDVGQVLLPLDHGTILAEAEAAGLEPSSGLTHVCFRDRNLIQPDDFRLQVAGAGVEPTPGRSEGSVHRLDDPHQLCFWTIAKCERFGEKELNPHPLLQRQAAYHYQVSHPVEKCQL